MQIGKRMLKIITKINFQMFFLKSISSVFQNYFSNLSSGHWRDTVEIGYCIITITNTVTNHWITISLWNNMSGQLQFSLEFSRKLNGSFLESENGMEEITGLMNHLLLMHLYGTAGCVVENAPLRGGNHMCCCTVNISIGWW